MHPIYPLIRNALWAIDGGAIRRLSAVIGMNHTENMTSDKPMPMAVDYFNRGGPIAADGDFSSVEPGDKVVAVIPLSGLMEARGPDWLEYFGFVLMDRWAKRFNDLVASDRVGAIVIDIDSPGGSAYGVAEAARAVFAARGTKPIISLVRPMAASGAYWMAAAADEIVATPSSDIGSVGVVAVHLDLSKADEAAGLTWTVITAGKYKWEDTDTKPLSEDAKAHIQKRVNDYYALYTGDLRRFRKDAKVKAPSDFGGGRMFGAAESVEMGLADRVATFEETVGKLADKLAKSSARSKRVQAALASV